MDNLVTEIADQKERVKQIGILKEKRISNIAYLKRIYETEKRLHWMNVVAISKNDLTENVDAGTIDKRTKIWFCLGVSLAPLIRIDNMTTFVRSLSQMMEEFDYFIGNSSVQALKAMMAFKGPAHTVNMDNEFESFKPKLHKVNNAVAYEYLNVFNIPCELDYFQIIFALCDICKLIYSKLEVEQCSNKHIYEIVMKLDGRLNTNFFKPLKTGAMKSAEKILASQTADVDSLFKSWDQLS